MRVSPGERRVEVRLISAKENFDDINGVQVRFHKDETTELKVSRGRFSGRLKIGVDEEEQG